MKLIPTTLVVITVGKPTATRTRKGQAASEMMVTIGMILVFVVPIVLLLLVGAQARFESLSHVQAGSTVRIVADSINEVYVEGRGPNPSTPGASKVAILNIPSNARSIRVSGNEVIITLETRSGPADVAATFFGEVHEDSQMEILNEGGGTPVGLFPMKFYVDEDGLVVIEHEGV
jgi:hypothetical protein